MKKFYIIPFLVIILSALILVGCSSPAPTTSSQPASQAPTSKPATSAPSTSAAPTSPAASAPAGKVIELRFAHQNPP